MQRRRHAEPIGRAGKIAGLATGLCLAVAGLAYTTAAGVAVMCVHRCAVRPSLAGLALFLTVPALLLGIAVTRGVARRPVVEGESDAWTWGLGVLFALGVAVTVSRLPSYTCPAGRYLDANFPICFDRKGLRTDAADWLGVKVAVALAAAAVGLTLVRWSRAVVVAAPLSAVAWFVGAGWLLTDTLARGLSR